jgi:hypothetical protein
MFDASPPERAAFRFDGGSGDRDRASRVKLRAFGFISSLAKHGRRLLRPAQRGMPLDNSTSCDNYPTSSLQPSNVFLTSAMN